jgi:hypothetical protein
MTTAITSAPEGAIAEPRSLGDLVRGLGGIPLSRILAKPAPGTATVSDVIDATGRYNRLYELVDGALVEKVMEYRESLFALFVARILLDFVEPRNLGLVSGADGTMNLIRDRGSFRYSLLMEMSRCWILRGSFTEAMSCTDLPSCSATCSRNWISEVDLRVKDRLP